MFDYMVYYSKNKVDMLYEQLTDGALENFQGKLGFNLGVVNGEISTSENSYISYISKLRVVLEYLKTENLVGGIKEYKDYIQGPLLMGWETFDITHWGTRIVFSNEDHMYIVTLFGSKENVIGVPFEGVFDSNSIYPAYVNFAKENFNSEKITEPYVWQLMEGINREYVGELLPYEFVAKVLYRETLSREYIKKNNHLVSGLETFKKTTYILATPLYVGLPHGLSERIRRIDGKNYIAIDDFSKELNSKRSICKTGKNLIIILKNMGLVEEAHNFKTEIENLGEKITKSDFMDIAKKYFIIEK